MEVLIGEEPNKQRFTVHKDLFTRHSKFLEAATSFHWTLGIKKPVDLVGYEPEVFASYMQCVYLGSVMVPALPRYNGKNTLEGLIVLYLLADKLNDITSANLIIDQIIRHSEVEKILPSWTAVTLAYESTVAGSPLPKLCRDYSVHEEKSSQLGRIQEGTAPFDFLKDVMLELHGFASHKGPLEQSRKVKCVKREKCYYHQHDEEHSKCV